MNKKSLRETRWAVGLSVGVLALSAPRTVQAGTWYVNYQWAAESTQSGTTPVGSVNVDESVSTMYGPVGRPTSLEGPYQAGVAVFARSKMKVRPVFIYVPNGTLQNDPMPTQIYIKEKPYAGVFVTEKDHGVNRLNGAIAGASGSINTTWHGSMSSVQPNSIFTFTPNATGQGDVLSAQRIGSRLSNLVTAGAPLKSTTVLVGDDSLQVMGYHVYGPYHELFARGEIAGQIDNGSVRTMVQYSAEKDTRSLKLTRNVGNKERIVLENEEWHTYGDTIYGAAPSGLGLPYRPYLTIRPAYDGPWLNPAWNVTPTWTNLNAPNPLLQNRLDESAIRLFGDTVNGSPLIDGLGVYSGTPTPARTVNMRYTAVDNGDGVQGNAYYHITLHDPVEKATIDTFTTYTVEAPVKNGSQTVWFGGPIGPTNNPKVSIGSSVEYGVALDATIDINPFKSFLSFSAAANYEAKSTFSVSTDLTVPTTSANFITYLKARHPYQRKHVRFYKYDESGKIKRMVTRDFQNTLLNPPMEAYHEAVQDTAGLATYEWVTAFNTNIDVTNLPRIPAPPVRKDFSGDVA